MKMRYITLSSASLLLAASLLGGVSQAHAQTVTAAAPAARVGFVNTDRLFSEARSAQDAQSRLRQEFSSRERELTEQGASVKQAVEDFEKNASRMPEAQRNQRREKVMAMDADFQQKRREFQEDLNNRKNEELQKLLDKANRIVNRIAKEGHFDLIVQEAVYVDKKLDITDKVIEALNAGN